MEARIIPAALVAASLFSLGASHRTENFIVTAPTEEFATKVAESAEKYRHDLAIEWLGSELPPWQDKCPIRVHVGPQYGAGGTTSFMFENHRPFGWSMSIQGSRERIIDSVLPHEITHTVFATHFGGPLPRWADEGACTTVEHISERQKQHDMLYEFLTTRRGIAFNDMFAMKQYPSDILPLYAQGFSLARFFIQKGGKRKFIEYVGDGMKWNNWTKATNKHYGFESLSELQLSWLAWVRKGSPQLPPDLPTVSPDTAIVQASATETQDLVAVAASATHADDETAGGWYARIRDEALAGRTEPRAIPAKPASYSREPAGDRDIAPQTVTRPQPIGRPRQIVLEWSRPTVFPGPAPVTAARPRTSPTHPSRVSSVVPDFPRTLWR